MSGKGADSRTIGKFVSTFLVAGTIDKELTYLQTKASGKEKENIALRAIELLAHLPWKPRSPRLSRHCFGIFKTLWGYFATQAWKSWYSTEQDLLVCVPPLPLCDRHKSTNGGATPNRLLHFYRMPSLGVCSEWCRFSFHRNMWSHPLHSEESLAALLALFIGSSNQRTYQTITSCIWDGTTLTFCRIHSRSSHWGKCEIITTLWW